MAGGAGKIPGQGNNMTQPGFEYGGFSPIQPGFGFGGGGMTQPGFPSYPPGRGYGMVQPGFPSRGRMIQPGFGAPINSQSNQISATPTIDDGRISDEDRANFGSITPSGGIGYIPPVGYSRAQLENRIARPEGGWGPSIYAGGSDNPNAWNYGLNAGAARDIRRLAQQGKFGKIKDIYRRSGAPRSWEATRGLLMNKFGPEPPEGVVDLTDPNYDSGDPVLY